jgi:hypothetical protein
MANQDMHNNISNLVALDFQTISTDTTTQGAIIDTQNFYSLEFLLFSGTITDGDYAIKMEDGDDSGLSDAADVNSDFILGSLSDAAFAAADDNTTKRVGYVGNKRYVRLSIVSTNVSSGGDLGALAIKGHPRSAPTA